MFSPVQLCNLVDCSSSDCPWNFPGKNTGEGYHFLLQGIFPIQGWNLSPVPPALADRFFTTEPPSNCVHDATVQTPEWKRSSVYSSFLVKMSFLEQEILRLLLIQDIIKVFILKCVHNS